MTISSNIHFCDTKVKYVVFREAPRKQVQQELKNEHFTEQMPLFAILTFTNLIVRVNQRKCIDWKKRPSFFTFAENVSKRKSCPASFCRRKYIFRAEGGFNEQCRGNFLLGPKSDELGLFLIYFSSMALTNNKRMLFSPPLFLSFLQDKAGEEGKTY
jgi:hypothetical protein